MQINSNIAGINVGDSYPVRIMGIINLSPESFYTGSVYETTRDAVEIAKKMVEEHCDILDVGGRSTAPGVDPISVQTEKERVIPILKALLEEVTIPISVDTQYAEVARDALKLGCHIVNDVSGLVTDPKLVEIAMEYDCPLILMATEKVPGDRLTMNEIMAALNDSISLATKNGIKQARIVVDPGIGRWISTKTYEYNLRIINQLHDLRKIGKPILIGISRKSFIGDILKIPEPVGRLVGSLSATAIAIYNGVHIVRTHDVGTTWDTIKIAEALKKEKANLL